MTALPPRGEPRHVTRRGDGIGLELTSTVIRGVRLATDEPGRVAAAAEAPIHRPDDDGAIVDALVRVNGQLGQEPVPARVGWFPNRCTMQRRDATGLTGPELNAMRRHLVETAGVTSTMLVEIDARRWMLALRWDHHTAGRLEQLVERAGFVDVTVEPAPVALARVLGGNAVVARRDAADDQSWTVILDGYVPIAAASVASAQHPYPDLIVTSSAHGLHQLDDVLGGTELADVVDIVASDAIAAFGRRGELNLGLTVSSREPYPPFPAHDLRAPQRQAVALGAAVGAAGLAGRLRPVDVLSPTTTSSEIRRPWAIERVVDLPERDLAPRRPRPRPRWRRKG